MVNQEKIKKLLSDKDERNYLKTRESTTIEFKEKFQFSNMSDYLKTLAAFANNRGGVIIFGVKDSPRIPCGVNRDKFDQIDSERISSYLTDYFHPQFEWEMDLISESNMWFGYISVEEADTKPIVCKMNSGSLKNGDIYYRYRGQSKKIEWGELSKIIDAEKNKEKELWMEHIKKITALGPQNVAFVDLHSGKIDSSHLGNTFLLDDILLENLKSKVGFIEEGSFSEKEGKPTLKLVGELKSSKKIVMPNLDPNKDYPYTNKELANKLLIRPYDSQVLIWKYQLKSNKRYCISIESGTNKIFKFSNYAYDRIKEILDEELDKENFLSKLSKEYSKRNQSPSSSVQQAT